MYFCRQLHHVAPWHDIGFAKVMGWIWIASILIVLFGRVAEAQTGQPEQAAFDRAREREQRRASRCSSLPVFKTHRGAKPWLAGPFLS